MGKRAVLPFIICMFLLLYALLQPAALLAAPALLVAGIHMPAMRRVCMPSGKRRKGLPQPPRQDKQQDTATGL